MEQEKIQGSINLSTLAGGYHLIPESEEDLVILLHGKAGNRQVMTIFEKSFSTKANFIYPEADLTDPLGGFSWWLEASPTNYDLAASKIHKFIEEIIEKFRLKPKRVIACGFSQGGASLSWISQRNEGLFSHLMLICSFYLPRHEQINEYPETFIYHGLTDQIVTIDQALVGVQYLASTRTPLTFISDKQGHKISSKGMRALKDWILREL